MPCCHLRATADNSFGLFFRPNCPAAAEHTTKLTNTSGQGRCGIWALCALWSRFLQHMGAQWLLAEPVLGILLAHQYRIIRVLWLILCYLVLYFSLNHVKLIYTRKKLLFYFLLKINEKKKLKMLFFILNCKSWYIFVWFNSKKKFIWYSQVNALKYNLAVH